MSKNTGVFTPYKALHLRYLTSAPAVTLARVIYAVEPGRQRPGYYPISGKQLPSPPTRPEGELCPIPLAKQLAWGLVDGIRYAELAHTPLSN